MFTFSDYSKEYLKQASYLGISEEESRSVLEYAKNLFDKGVPIIYDLHHFSYLVGYEFDFVKSLCSATASYYIEYRIPKRNGHLRTIDEPYPSLKEIQTWILRRILSPIGEKTISPYAKAFISGRNLKDNARYHRNKKVVIKLDLRNFFGSIHFPLVFNIFKEIGYNDELCRNLSALCLFRESLPQGAPTSPIISNIVFSKLDYVIFNYCQTKSINYTRYADDMTFSSNENVDVKDLIFKVRDLIKPSGFTLNYDKIQVLGKGTRQIVTGIVVNEKLQTSKTFRRKLRQEIFYITRYGIQNHLKRIQSNYNTLSYLYRILGQINFVLQINKDDKWALSNRLLIRASIEKEKQKQYYNRL